MGKQVSSSCRMGLGQEGHRAPWILLLIIIPILCLPAISRDLLMKIHTQVLINKRLLQGSELETRTPQRGEGCQ